MKRAAVLIGMLLAVSGAAVCTRGGTTDKPPQGPFGLFLSPQVFDIEDRVRIAQELGAYYFRTYPVLLPSWNGECSECQIVQDAGLHFVLTIRNTPSIDEAASPVADLDGFKRTVGEILDLYKPALVVLENEENTPSYFTGTPEQYVSELAALCEVAHSRDIPCANGGLLSGSVTWMVYFHYLDTGQTAEAKSFEERGLEPFQQKRLETPGGDQDGRKVADLTMRFLTQYKGAGADYLNIHWYVSDNQALEESVDYLSGLAGLPIVTNEIGQRNLEPSVTTALMNMVLQLRLPFAVWFSSDGRLSQALVDPDGSIRPTGEAFQSFIKSNYG